MASIPADDRATWVRVGMAVKAELGDAGFDLWDRWSQMSDGYRERDAAAVWRSISVGHGVTVATLFWLARDHGWRPDDQSARSLPPPSPVRRPAPQASAGDDALKLKRAGELWAQAIPIRGTLTQRYLEHRGCALPNPAADLRHLDRVDIFGFNGPAMVGRISATQDHRVLQGLHLTWVEADGRGRRERRYLGRKGGGVIRLWPEEGVTCGLAIAEGIETALAAAHDFVPIWATMDAGNLAAFPVLDGVDALTIFADRDESGTGQAAAAEAGRRWNAAGREVRILMSSEIGRDIADEVAA